MECIGTAREPVCHGRTHTGSRAFRKILGDTGKCKEAGRPEKGEEMSTVDLNMVYKSVLEADRAAVVICDLEHKIIYMNPAAISRYEKWGGKGLLGKSLLDCHNEKSREMIQKVVGWFRESKDNNLVYTSYNQKENKDVYMVALRDESGDLIAYYEKHEYRDKETMKMYDIK